MTTLFLLHFSQLTQSDMMKSVKEFMQKTGMKDPSQLINVVRQEGGLTLTQYTPEELDQIKQVGIIYLFKIGQITEEAFVRNMNQKIAINLDFNTFKECWNAMCKIQEETIVFLRAIEQLQIHKDFNIHVIGNTNSMHAKYIEEQFQQAGINIQMSRTFSFETGCLDPEPSAEQTNGLQVIDLRNKTDILSEIRETLEVKVNTTLKCKPE